MKLSACCIAILLAMMTAGGMSAQQHDPGRRSAGVDAHNELTASMKQMHAAMGSTTKVGLLVAGFGLSGWLPVLNTHIMSLPSMTPSLMAAFVVLVNMAIYMAGFISPLAVGLLSQRSFGLRNSLALFSCIELVAILMFMRIPTIARDL